MRAPIHSKKHYVQTSLTSVTTGAEVDIPLVFAVETPTSVLEVVEGAIVKAVYWELWVIGTTADQFFTIIFAKYPGGVNAATITEMAALGDWDNKKNILYTTQGLAANDGVSNPIPIYRGWIKIPKGKQRMGLGDTIKFQVASRGDATINVCGFATYKEYT